MFTSANSAAARLSALENNHCLKAVETPERQETDSFSGNTLGKGRQGKKPLGASLVSVAALISKLDEQQPTQWESRSAPTLQLKPVRKTDEALRIFLRRVEAARVNRQECEEDTTQLDVEESAPDSQTVTLDNIPAYEREVRRTAYSLLMKRCGPDRNFVTASDNRFNSATNILTARAEAMLLSERLLRRVEHGFTVNTPAWTLTTSNTENTAALFEACRTPQSVKVSVKNCHSQKFASEQSSVQTSSYEDSKFDDSLAKPQRKTDYGVIPRIISGIIEAAERMPRLNVADVPVNAMSAATTVQ